MGVKIQRPGEPGHPGETRRIYVRVNYQGHRRTRVFNSSKGAQEYAGQVEAMLKLGKVEDVFAAPAPAPEPTPGPTFAEVADRWKAVDGASLKPGTREDYASILTKHILPTFRTRPVADITAADLETWWAEIRANGLSRDRLVSLRAVLAGIFKRAVASEAITRNPVAAITGRMGKEDREVRQVEWLTEPELSRVLAVAAQREPRYYPMLLTIASTGLRLGEARSLQVGDVDLERGQIHVRRTIRKYHVGSPKSGKARTVDVPASTVAVLRGWIDLVRAEAAVRGEEACWLFPGPTGQPMDERGPRQALGRCLKPAGIPRGVRLHDLRHTYASLALQRGVPLLVVSRQLGHASIAVTADVYGHLAPDATREAADAWEAILTAPGRNPRATCAPEPS